MKKALSDTYRWKVCEVVHEAPKVSSLILEAEEKRPSFISGQYLTIQLPGFEPAEGKSYSISSSEETSLVRLTIKEMGTFSRTLCALKVGDVITTSAPYGFFYPEHMSDTELIFIAGGIGITPCMSIIETLAKEGYPKNVFLFYSNRTISDTIFKKDLLALQESFPRLKIMYHLTREIVPFSIYKNGRITGASIIESVPTFQSTDFFVCGSIDFTKSLWRELRNVGVSSTQIYTEGYF